MTYIFVGVKLASRTGRALASTEDLKNEDLLRVKLRKGAALCAEFYVGPEGPTHKAPRIELRAGSFVRWKTSNVRDCVSDLVKLV